MVNIIISISSVIFWTTALIIFYNYIGYGILLKIIVSVQSWFKERSLHSGHRLNASENLLLPKVTLIVAAYNEEAVMEQKIENTLSLAYPKDKLNLLFITDGSTDRTAEIVRGYPQIRLMHSPIRGGKTAALNRAMAEVTTPIVIFCDANTLLNKEAVLKIVAHYTNPAVGGVSGEKRVFAKNNEGQAVAQEGLYWKYESALKRLDSALYTVVGAAGELFSIRTALWENLDDRIILDDFVVSMRVNLKGYRVAYEPEAYATEMPSSSIREERKRKIRIVAGGFQAMTLLKPLFNVFKHPVLFFQFFSHRFLRWAVVPLALPVLFIASTVLAGLTSSVIYTLALYAQVLFYTMALFGAFTSRQGTIYKLLRICYYIVFMNVMVYPGFYRFVSNKQSATWEKVERQAAVSF